MCSSFVFGDLKSVLELGLGYFIIINVLLHFFKKEISIFAIMQMCSIYHRAIIYLRYFHESDHLMNSFRWG